MVLVQASPQDQNGQANEDGLATQYGQAQPTMPCGRYRRCRHRWRLRVSSGYDQANQEGRAPPTMPS
eukprot:scaffold162157_cov10-Tisochrysis_lutea.AAC.1